MAAFASYADVPQDDVDAHRATPTFEGTAGSTEPTVMIHSGKEKPENAFASVFYRNTWFWVDDGDLKTKRALTAVMFFFTLTEKADEGQLPLVTIPAQ